MPIWKQGKSAVDNGKGMVIDVRGNRLDFCTRSKNQVYSCGMSGDALVRLEVLSGPLLTPSETSFACPFCRGTEAIASPHRHLESYDVLHLLTSLGIK